MTRDSVLGLGASAGRICSLASGLVFAASLQCAPLSGNGPVSGTSPRAGDDGGVASDSAGTAKGQSSAPASGPAAVRWIGRTDTSNPNAVKFAWSGSGFIATVAGPRISVLLQTEGTSSSTFFQPVVDGVVGGRFQVPPGAPQTVVLGSGLTAGDHVVELYRESEASFGDNLFEGFVDGTLKSAPPPPGRLIEVVGDSISAGYGNLGNETHPASTNACTFSLDTESAYQSYGAMVGRALGAEVSIIARSGWGMVRDFKGNTSNVMPSIYGNALGTATTPAWSFARKADVVVVNLGTNDSNAGGGGDPGTAFEAAYVGFLQTVRGHYPDAWIFLTIGPMTTGPLLTTMRTHLGNIVLAMGDSKIATIDMATQDTSSTGCDFHPNVAEDQAMAAVVTAAIRTKLPW
jgi:lysophospholipase L1-like esterase